jgi:serine/threonine protein kinase
LGILTYELLSGVPPFDGENDEELFESILKNPIDFKSTIFTLTAGNFVQGLLTRNPSERLGCKTDIRNHLWFEQSLYSFEQIEQQSLSAVYIPSNLIDYTNYPLKSIEVTSNKYSINEKLFENF